MTRVNPYWIVKQAGISPGFGTLAGIGIGGGIGYLLNKLDELNGKEPEDPWSKPLLGALIGGLPYWTYGLARNSWDYDNKGEHTLSLWDRWTMDDDAFWNQPAPNANWKNDLEHRRNFYSFWLTPPKQEAAPKQEQKSKPESKDVASINRNGADKTAEWVTNMGAIPVNAFNETTWVDASRGRTPMEAAGFVTNTLNQTRNRVGSNLVSPGQVINTMVNAGIGYGTAWLAGKTLGAMAGVSPETQKKLCEIGTWGGMLGGISNAANNY